MQSRSVCRSRTVNIDKGTIPYMAPEILLGSEISRAGATVEDLLVVDMWAYGMLLYNLLNPCLHHLYEEVVKQEETGDTKDKIVRSLRDGRRLSPSEKYAETVLRVANQTGATFGTSVRSLRTFPAS